MCWPRPSPRSSTSSRTTASNSSTGSTLSCGWGELSASLCQTSPVVSVAVLRVPITTDLAPMILSRPTRYTLRGVQQNMNHQVLVVEDDQLPSGTDWALARVEDHAYLILRRSRCSVEGGLCDLLAEVWSTRVSCASVDPSLAVAV